MTTRLGHGAEALTVFVLTCGEPSTGRCFEALRAQDCEFRLEIIEGVSPLDRPVQQMLDRCRTPHFVLVEADMILEPDAIRRLHEALLEEPPDVAIFLAYLWGDVEEMPISGRIFRHEIVRRFPYRSVFSSDVIQTKELEQAGYRIASAPYPGTGTSGETARRGVLSIRAAPSTVERRRAPGRNLPLSPALRHLHRERAGGLPS